MIISRNGKAFGDADVQISIFGSIDYEVTKLEYSVEQTHEANYSVGSDNPTSYRKGRKTYNCTLGLRLKSVSAIEKAAGGSLLEIKPFPIVVNYVDDENEMITDIITAKFTEQGRSVGDDDDLKREFKMFCTNIQFNVE